VEYYLPIRELEVQKKAEGHLIFEEWRNKTPAQIREQNVEYRASIARSFAGYDTAFQAGLERMGTSRDAAEASWSKAEYSLRDAARKSASSSGITTSSSVRGSFSQVPSGSLWAETSPANSITRADPSSTSAKSGIADTSNTQIISAIDNVNDLPGPEVNSARAALDGLDEFSDVPIEMPDGTTVLVRDVLADLESDRSFDAFIQACAITPAGVAQ
jgi:hypothetical protein